MSLNIHVFIATNKGLVAIQSITDLQDSALQSVITLNGSTDLANISPAYHRFVQKSTGLIQNEFGGTSFRANMSRNIDHGNSWQLPFYLAHLVQAATPSMMERSPNFANVANDTRYAQPEFDAIHLGHGAPKPGDVVLIATGQINTSTGAIEAVEQVPEKCITASAQIKLWVSKGILVEFFVPAMSHRGQASGPDSPQADTAKTASEKKVTEQARQLLPELDCAIYPVTDTHQLKQHIEQLLPLNKLHQLRTQEPISKAIIAPEIHTIKANTMRPIKANGLKRKMAAMSLLAIGLLSVMVYWLVIASPHTSNTRFIAATKTGPHCDSNALMKVTNIGTQYVTRIPSTSLNSACSMTLLSNKNTPQVWLIADTKTVIELSSTLIDNERHWLIPLPSQQQASREYILVVTEKQLDLADLAAFKSYLSRLKPTQKPSVELLAAFFSQIGINPQYVSQELVFVN